MPVLYLSSLSLTNITILLVAQLFVCGLTKPYQTQSNQTKPNHLDQLELTKFHNALSGCLCISSPACQWFTTVSGQNIYFNLLSKLQKTADWSAAIFYWSQERNWRGLDLRTELERSTAPWWRISCGTWWRCWPGRGSSSSRPRWGGRTCRGTQPGWSRQSSATSQPSQRCFSIQLFIIKRFCQKNLMAH